MTNKRLVEMIPGLITWGFVLIMILMSFIAPIAVAYIVVFYCIYFVYEAISLVILMMISSRKVKRVMDTNWIEELDKLHEDIDWHDIYQAIMIPYANEGIEVLRPTIQCIVDGNYPKERKLLLLATEERLEKGYEIAQQLKEEFKEHFLDIIITRHRIVAGEIIGKASNENYAAQELYKYIMEHEIDPKHVLVTSCDSDGRQHAQYMARLTYCFLTEPDREKRIYQPLLMFFNNIWQVSFISRMIATFSIQWQLGIALKPHRSQNFAIYALCLDTLHKVNYWSPDIIPEDERIFWETIMYYGKDLKIVHLYIPISLDAVKAKGYIRSLKEQYVQIRRWAWGASEISYSLPNISKNKKIPFSLKVLYISQQIRKSFEWALTPFILFFGLSLPSALNPAFSRNILSYSLPAIISKILTATTVLMLSVFYIEALFAPKKPAEWSYFRRGFSLLQWISFPFVSILFSGIPALEAQTRLIIGKPIQYVVTEKAQD